MRNHSTRKQRIFRNVLLEMAVLLNMQRRNKEYLDKINFKNS